MVWLLLLRTVLGETAGLSWRPITNGPASWDRRNHWTTSCSGAAGPRCIWRCAGWVCAWMEGTPLSTEQDWFADAVTALAYADGRSR